MAKNRNRDAVDVQPPAETIPETPETPAAAETEPAQPDAPAPAPVATLPSVLETLSRELAEAEVEIASIEKLNVGAECKRLFAEHAAAVQEKRDFAAAIERKIGALHQKAHNYNMEVRNPQEARAESLRLRCEELRKIIAAHG